MMDCFTKVSPSAATSALASASGSDGKLPFPSTISGTSTSVSSSIHLPRGCEHINGVHRLGEQGFRTPSSQSGRFSWGEQWAFEMFTSERGTSYSDYASGSGRLLEESTDRLNPGLSRSAQGKSQDLRSIWAYNSSRSVDEGTSSPLDRSDGAAVVALLSSSNFATQSLQDGELDDETERDQNESKTPQFKPEANAELRILATVNPLYLLPEFDREASDVPERGPRDPFTSDTFSTRTPTSPPSASDLWQPWIRMNDSYLVDVWDVLGLAKEHVYSEAVIPHDDAEVLGQEYSATSRLAMIRKHIDYLDKW